MSPLQVLLVSKGLGLGGAETLLVSQVARRDPTFVDYHVAYLRPDKDHFVARLTDAGATTECLGTDPAWVRRLGRLVRSGRFGLVHSHAPLPAAAARVLSRGHRGVPVPHVYTEHNRWAAYRAATRVANAATMPLDARTWAVSEDARASVIAPLRRRVHTLVHGVDVQAARAQVATGGERAARRRELGLDPSDLVFVNVANHRPAKAHDVLLAAFAMVASEVSTARLVLVGQDLHTTAFAGMVAASGAGDRVTVLGYRDDAIAVMGVADALVMSSDHEGLPVAVMEALAVGLPVASTSVGGIPEAVRHGVEGLLVPPRDPAALATACIEVADPVRRAALADGARRRAGAFDVDVAVTEVERAYRSLTEGRPPADRRP